MKKRRRLITQADPLESSFELDLSPMLALMVTLIPIMLLSTVFVKIMVIDTKLPQVVEQVMKEEKNKPKDVTVVVRMKKSSGFEAIVKKGSRTQLKKRLPVLADGWDYKGLHRELASIKRSHPNTFRLELEPDSTVPYEEIVKVMDEARRFSIEEGKVVVKSQETGEQAETELMFPNVVFSNVVGG